MSYNKDINYPPSYQLIRLKLGQRLQLLVVGIVLVDAMRLKSMFAKFTYRAFFQQMV